MERCLTLQHDEFRLQFRRTLLAMLPTAQGPILAAGSDDGSIRLLSAVDRSLVASLHVHDHSEPVATLTTVRTADERWLLVGVSRSGMLRLWRHDTRQQVHRLRLDGPIEASCAFGSCLAIATRRGLSLLTLTFPDSSVASSYADEAAAPGIPAIPVHHAPGLSHDGNGDG
jgi:WD40 repeat protein